jgi:hypothetical protein
MFPRRKRQQEQTTTASDAADSATGATSSNSASSATAIKTEQPKSLFDATVEQDSQVVEAFRTRTGTSRVKPVTYVSKGSPGTTERQNIQQLITPITTVLSTRLLSTNHQLPTLKPAEES